MSVLLMFWRKEMVTRSILRISPKSINEKGMCVNGVVLASGHEGERDGSGECSCMQ